jgi:AhpD family alkylhydroperoxidase
MSEDVKVWLQDFKKGAQKVKEQAPDTINGFGNMFAKIMQDGAIPLQTKELIAVAIGVAVQCEPCIKLHTQKCLDVGCSREEIVEAASVAVMMGGGPAYTHLPVVVETLDALQEG